jgi:hypothetical protein
MTCLLMFVACVWAFGLGVTINTFYLAPIAGIAIPDRAKHSAVICAVALVITFVIGWFQ